MLIAEVVLRKTYIEDKIQELKNYIKHLSTLEGPKKSELYSLALKRLFELIDKKQSHDILLDQENSNSKIKLKTKNGEKELSKSDAIRITDSLSHQIDILTDVINGGDTIAFFELMDQRDSFLEEYLAITKQIKLSDWSTEIG
jgi:hypothetical protein